MANRSLETKTPLVGKGVKINVRCRNCIHHKRVPYYSNTCAKMGIGGHTIPCKHFKADPAQLDVNAEHMTRATRIISKLPTGMLPILAALINQEQNNRRQGFYLGQIVYTKFGPDDYLSEYVQAKVVSSSKDFVHVRGKDNWTATLKHQSVMTAAEFAVKRADLQAKGRLRKPGATTPTLAILKGEYQPPQAEQPVSRKRGRKPAAKPNGTVRVRG